MESYSEDVIQRLELLWGEGFLSPGGADEVEAIMDGLELEGRSVLDIGCGTGGAEVVLVQSLRAERVVALDVEAPLVGRTRARAERAQIADRVDARLVRPGPLELADASFDVVFTKDSLIHLPDKRAMFAEIFRVLRPGGAFASSEWLAGDRAAESATWARFLELGPPSFCIETPDAMTRMLREAGFEQIRDRDRSAWLASVAAREVEQLEGPLRARAIELIGADAFEPWLEFRRALRDVAAAGDLRPTHLRAIKSPAA